MKKIIVTILAVIFTTGICFSQDVITKKSGEEIQAKVLEVGQTDIKYKYFNNPDGPAFTIPKSDVLMIRYENGVKDIFSEPSQPAEIKLPPAAAEPATQPVEKKEFKPAHRYHNRIGFNFGGGSGFQSVPIGTMSDRTVVSISFGGGTGGNFEYGYEFSRHFDLAFNIGYQTSSLDQTIDNASMAFNRGYISLTPSFILPLTHRDKTRFKLGLGIDWFFYAQLNFDLSKVSDGVKDDWIYNNGIGEHLSIIFELNTKNRRFSFDFGLKAYNANFSFQSGSFSYPKDDELGKPNGSGIDFLLGVYYHFNWRRTRN
jgi:hypothetical protein